MRGTQPPRLAAWLFERLASGPNRESLGGDLAEQYQRGRSSAWYWRQAVYAMFTGAARDLREHKLLALRAIGIGVASMWMFWALASIPLRIIWVLSNGGLYLGGHWITLDYSWMHYRGYLALLLIVVGSAGSGWIVARLHREHQAAMVFAFLVALVLAAVTQLVIQVRLVGWPVRPMIHSAPTIIVLFIVTPISVLVGGLWTDYGTRTTGARQNATF
jgi:hypothetical protein